MANVETLEISSTGSLDLITVYWHNYEPGKGMVTIVCWGRAWTAYFGGMMRDTIQVFFSSCGVDYLINKLVSGKQTKRDDAYLVRIIHAIQLAQKEQS